MATRQLSRKDLITVISLSDSSYLDHHFQEKDKGKSKEKETDKKPFNSREGDKKGKKRKGH
jgi:hypothetical protein